MSDPDSPSGPRPRVKALKPAGKRGDRIEVRLNGLDDDERRLTVPASTVAELGLSPGTPLSPDDLRLLQESHRRREALDRALGYLSHRARSRAELERYLRRKGYQEPVRQAVLGRCRELGYLDDRAFAESYVRDRIRLKPRGAFRLRMELKKKGVDPAVAEEAVEAAFRDVGVTERELLERAARKRWEARRSEDPRTIRRRLYGYLKRRGFRAGEIREVVDELMGELE